MTKRCDGCLFFGGELLVNEDDGKTYGTCRVELPTESNAARRFKHGAINGVVANHGWVPVDYWCGRFKPAAPPVAASEIVADGGTVEDK